MSIICPHCGSPLRRDAVACRECGSDFETGWSEDIDYHSIELPEDEEERVDRGGQKTIAIICVVLLLASSGVILALGIRNLALLLLILGLLLPIVFGKHPGGPNDPGLR